MHFNASKSNQFGLDFQNDAIDQVQLLSLIHSNFGLHNQNDLISLRGTTQPITSSLISQLGLGQRVIEVRRTYVTPRVIDYNINVTEIVRTQEVVRTQEFVSTHLLTATSTRDRIFIPNDDHEIHIQGQPSFQSQSIPMPNQLYPSFTYQRKPFHDHHFQNPRHYQNPSHFQNPSHIPNYSHFQNPSENQPLKESNSNPLKFLIPVNANSNSDDHEEESTDQGDGRTHSLPCKKYGPYTCPKCKGVFFPSQSFAAHMGSHYKYESSAERKRRQAAKCKRNGRRSTMHKKAQTAMKIEEKDDEVERKEEVPPPELAAEEGLIDVEIKEEPMELIIRA